MGPETRSLDESNHLSGKGPMAERRVAEEDVLWEGDPSEDGPSV